MGIEPMRSENSSFLDCRLNHSAKVSIAKSRNMLVHLKIKDSHYFSNRRVGYFRRLRYFRRA